MPKQPYNPATSGPQVQVHDRRARQVNRGLAAHLVEAEVEDPYQPGARIGVLRSVRDDPLADHLSRGHIDQAQYLAGREFQKHFQIAERGPRAVQWTDAVDGGLPHEPLTSAQLMAGKWLAKCYRKLGADGSALVNDMLISNVTAKQIAEARGLSGREWARYYSKRFLECLNTLASVFGFADGRRA
jgi:hypothetical protein